MHVSHMRSFVPEQALQNPAKAPQPAQAYNTQRVQPVPSGDGREPRGSRQQVPPRDAAKLTLFENSAAAVKSFSSQLAALDLASLGDAGSATAGSQQADASAGAEDPGIFQLLAKAASPSA